MNLCVYSLSILYNLPMRRFHSALTVETEDARKLLAFVRDNVVKLDAVKTYPQRNYAPSNVGVVKFANRNKVWVQS